MKANRILIALSLLAAVSVTACRKEFAELNQNPTAVTTAEPSYLATRAMTLFETNGYTYWFYNQTLFTRWAQMAASGAFSDSSYGHGAVDYQGGYVTMLNYRNDINKYVTDNEAPQYKAYAAMCGVLAIYGAIYSSDINGDIQYTEAAQYRNGGPLTPKYDKVADLYDLWVSELDEYIAIFQDNTQVVLGSQDIIYSGNTGRWAKLANSLKLKIAVRLYNNDSAKAKTIASSVLSSSAGYIDSMDDAFIYHKADAATGGDLAYQTGNSYSGWLSSSSRNVIEFMKASKDPRVRFFYNKNGYNSEIVKEFIKEDKYEDLPTFVKENIVLDEDGQFVSWKEGTGEPWVRYQGTPIVEFNSAEYKSYEGEYFNANTTRYQLVIGNANKTYGLTSGFSEEMVRGRVDFTLPTIPAGPSITDTRDMPWWGMYMGAGETNLYLAELAQLGVISGNAETYYKRGVELSVREWDFIAGKNEIPYYGADWVADHKYAADEASIELKEGEIETMLATANVAFTGSTADKLEKIYLQQLMNFTMMPNDLFVTARRSGYPKIGSSLLPFVKFNGISLEAIPRRFEFTEPLITDIMYDIRSANLKDQGFTPGANQSGVGFASGTVLNTERLWQDKNAPQWGSPK